MKPIIGIVLRSSDNIKYMNLNKEICKAIMDSGGIPIGIFPDINDINNHINICDGFILQGGDDFTNYDIELINLIYQINKPLLGICLGMQAMGHWGQGNILTINNLNHKQINKKYVHYINIVEGTKLYKILKQKKILVNSRHTDCVNKTKLNISAFSEDGIIEAVELPNHSFFVGLQWHPETVFDTDINSKLIFKSFVDSCKE